jgi:hypothetical protein
MNTENTYHGNCFCGSVQFTVTGAPAAMGFCHCGDCRLWSAGPINALTLWEPDAVKITKGADNIRTYNKTDRSLRKWCATCGGHLFTEHPQWNLINIYAATIPDFPFDPDVHVYYRESVLPIKDGLPKFRDLPMEMGGSGEMMDE